MKHLSTLLTLSLLTLYACGAKLPAEPVQPAFETEQEVSLVVAEGRDTIYGTLLLPEAARTNKVTAVLLIPGSGPTDRDGNTIVMSGKNNSLKMLAEALQANGIATLRIDKRGIAKSQFKGSQQDMRFDMFVSDAAAWLQYLTTHEKVDKVIAAGHSQGALVAAAGAIQVQGVDGYISLAGTGRRIDDVMRGQLRPQLPDNLYEFSDAAFKALRNGETVEDVPAVLNSLFSPQLQPFMMSWIKYDPIEVLRQLDSPKLFVFGSTDIQVKPADEKTPVATAFPDATIMVVEGMNHVLKPAPEEMVGNIATYTNPDLPLIDGLVSGMVAFIDGL